MTDLSFRPATKDDIPAMLRLAHQGDARGAETPALDEASFTDPRVLAAYDEIVGDKNHRLVVAELDGKVVGTIHLTFIAGLTRLGAKRGLLENVFIDAECRGVGLGSKLVLWAVEQCREVGCSIVQLTSNKVRLDAHRFYRKLGFEQSHEGFKLYL